MVARQHAATQRLPRSRTTPSSAASPAACTLKPSLTGRWVETQPQLCSLHSDCGGGLLARLGLARGDWRPGLDSLNQ